MAFCVKCMRSGGIVKEVYRVNIGEEAVLLRKERSLEFLSLENGVSLGEEVVGDIQASCMLPGQQLACVMGTYLRVLQFSEAKGWSCFKSVELQLQNLVSGIKSANNLVVVSSFYGDFKCYDSSSLELLSQAKVPKMLVDWDFVGEKILGLFSREDFCFHLIGLTDFEVSSEVSFQSFEENFPYKLLVLNHKILIFEEGALKVAECIGNSIETTLKIELEALVSSYAFAETLILATDEGELLSFSQNNLSKLPTKVPKDSFILNFQNCLMAVSHTTINTYKDFELTSSLPRNAPVLNGVELPGLSELETSSVLVSTVNSLRVFSNLIPCSLTLKMPEVGKSLLGLTCEPPYLFLHYPDTLKILHTETFQQLSVEELGMSGDYTLAVGKCGDDWTQVKTSGVGNYQGHVISAHISGERVILGLEDKVVCLKNMTVEWEDPAEEVSSVYCSEETAVVGFHNSKVKVYREGVCRGETTLEKNMVVNSILVKYGYLFLGTRDGVVVALSENLEKVTQKAIGKMPVSFCDMDKYFLANSEIAILIYSAELEFKQIEAEGRLFCRISQNTIASVTSEVSFYSLENPYNLSINEQVVLETKGVIKRILQLGNEIFYTVESEGHTLVEALKYPGWERTFCFRYEGKVNCLHNFNGVVALGCENSSERGQVVLIKDYLEVARATFTLSVQSIAHIENTLILCVKEYLVSLEVSDNFEFTKKLDFRFRNTVADLKTSNSYLFVGDSRDGLVIYQYTNHELEHIWTSPNPCLLHEILLTESYIVCLDKEGTVQVYRYETMDLLESFKLPEGGRCLLESNFCNNSLKELKKHILLAGWSGGLYQIHYEENSALKELQNKLLNAIGFTQEKSYIDLDLLGMSQKFPEVVEKLTQDFASVKLLMEKVQSLELF